VVVVVVDVAEADDVVVTDLAAAVVVAPVPSAGVAVVPESAGPAVQAARSNAAKVSNAAPTMGRPFLMIEHDNARGLESGSEAWLLPATGRQRSRVAGSG
jgi:hypothetical protein